MWVSVADPVRVWVRGWGIGYRVWVRASKCKGELQSSVSECRQRWVCVCVGDMWATAGGIEEVGGGTGMNA